MVLRYNRAPVLNTSSTNKIFHPASHESILHSYTYGKLAIFVGILQVAQNFSMYQSVRIQKRPELAIWLLLSLQEISLSCSSSMFKKVNICLYNNYS